MRIRYLVFVLVITIASVSFADNKDTFDSLYKDGNLDEMKAHLDQWISKYPDDPEVYVGYFNYYLALGRDTVTGTYRYPPPDGRYMELTKDGDDEVVGYMYDRITYEERNKNSAIDVIQNGIKKFPDRLDMRFGLIHTLQQIGEYENQSLVLKSALRYSLTNNNKWLWSRNQPTPGTQEFFLSVIQDYYSAWLRVSSPESLSALYETSKLQIELYPQNVFGYNIIAYYYSAIDNHAQAAHYLSLAYELEPNDYIIINNLAMAEMASANYERALRLFLRLRDFPDSIDQAYVEDRISAVEKLL